MTLPLPADWTTGSAWTATAEDNVETVLNNLGNGTLVIPRHPNITSAGTATLSTAYNVYVHTGSGGTWTLPAVAGNTGAEFLLTNRGSGTVAVTRAGADQLYSQGVALTSVDLLNKGSLRLVNDGTYWLVMSSAGAATIPTFDATAKKAASFASGATTTFTQTVAAGNPYGLVVVTGDETMASTCTGLVSFGGVSTPLLGTATYDFGLGSEVWAKLYGAANIPSGTQTVSVKLTKAGQSYDGEIFSFTYLGIIGAGTVTFDGNYDPSYPYAEWALDIAPPRVNSSPGRMFVGCMANPTFGNIDGLTATSRNSATAQNVCGDFGVCGSETQHVHAAFAGSYESLLYACDLYSSTG